MALLSTICLLYSGKLALYQDSAGAKPFLSRKVGSGWCTASTNAARPSLARHRGCYHRMLKEILKASPHFIFCTRFIRPHAAIYPAYLADAMV